MKRLISSVAFAALVSLSCVNAMAGTWLDNNKKGGVTGTFASFTPVSGAIDGPLSVTDFKFSSGTGAFSGATTSNTVVFGGAYNFDPFSSVLGDTYTFTTTTFGTFSGTIVDEQSSGTLSSNTGTGATRSFTLLGSFTPGSDAFFEGDRTTLANSTLSISFQRNANFGGGNGTVNASWSMDTSGASPAAVPEPTSIAIFGLGAVGFAVRRFRRK